MYAKLVDGQLIVAQQEIKTDTGTVTSPTQDILVQLGYKKVVYADKPEYDIENEKLVEVYSEKKSKIVVGYSKEQLSIQQHNDVIKQEIIEEENQITTRNMLDFMVDNDEEARTRIQTHRTKIAELRKKLIQEN